MKIYETPEIEIHKFEIEDVITTSYPSSGENDLPFVPAEADVDITD